MKQMHCTVLCCSLSGWITIELNAIESTDSWKGWLRNWMYVLTHTHTYTCWHTHVPTMTWRFKFSNITFINTRNHKILKFLPFNLEVREDEYLKVFPLSKIFQNNFFERKCWFWSFRPRPYSNHLFTFVAFWINTENQNPIIHILMWTWSLSQQRGFPIHTPQFNILSVTGICPQ